MSVCSIKEGLDGPIDNFIFRQCPAEFKLKAKIDENEPNWTVKIENTSNPPKTSLLQISHSKGIIVFPHHEKGSLAFAPLKNLAQTGKESGEKIFNYESLAFPGDESFISSFCIDPSENFIFVAKSSNKLYAVDLAKAKSSEEEFKKPFVSKISQLDSAVVDCIASEVHGLWVLLESGKLENFNFFNEENLLQKSEVSLDDVIKVPIGCISPIRNGFLAIGAKEKSEIFVLNLNLLKDSKTDLETLKCKMINFTVPSDNLNCGHGGISSIFLLPNTKNSLLFLFSCTPDNVETDNVPLILAEKFIEESSKLNSNEIIFSHFLDPCASRPPRKNQFYFLTLPVVNWSGNKENLNLTDLVVVSNFSSPDIGICGRLGPNEPFQTFYIDNDEGLAQLPFENGKVTYPVGICLDLSSQIPLENLNDPDKEPFPPAPILWILSNSAHLCPFSMLKTDETTEHSFMLPVTDAIFGTSTVNKAKEKELLINESEQIPAETTATLANISLEEQILPKISTPSKVPIDKLTSLQKSNSNEIQSTEKVFQGFNFKTAPTADSNLFQSIPSSIKPSVSQLAPSLPVKLLDLINSPIADKNVHVSVLKPELIEEICPIDLIKKEENMELIDSGPYKNILLSEISSTHVAMQNDLFVLKQISVKNTILIRQNFQKYFNSLEALKIYSLSLEKLLNSSEMVFGSLKDRLEDLRAGLKDLLGKTEQVKSTWSRIKQDKNINWEMRVKILSNLSQNLFERIDRLNNFLSHPSDSLKYRATFQSFIDSTHEKIQLLMAHLSGLFVSQFEEFSGACCDIDVLSLSPSLSDENLFDRFTGLSIENENYNNFSSSFNLDQKLKRINRCKSLLNAAKSRGARLIIPNASKPVSPIIETKIPKLDSIEDSLINSFISAINLTEEVPEFPEIIKLAQLSLSTDVDSKSTKSFFPSKASVQSEVSLSPQSQPSTVTKTSSPLKIADSISINKASCTNSNESDRESSLFKFKSNTVAAASPTISTSSEASTVKLSNNDKNSLEISQFNLKFPESCTSKSNELIQEIPKIPSIFTSKNTLTPVESVLRKESPLASFNSLNLNFGTKSEEISSKNIQETKNIKFIPSVSTSKGFPSVFGVKSKSDDVDLNTDLINESASQTRLSFDDPNSKSKETSPSLSIGFAPTAAPISEISIISKQQKLETLSTSNISTNTNTATPAFGATNYNLNTKIPDFGSTTTTPNISSLGTDSKINSFLNSESPSVSTKVSAFNFGLTSESLSSTPSVPIFGQTSLPSTGFGFGFNSTVISSTPAPVTATAGFAAFAAQSSTGTGFSSFTSAASNNSNLSGLSSGNGTGTGIGTEAGLTFASFLPADNKKSTTNDQSQSKLPHSSSPTNPSSTFSFSGFRE